MSETDALAGDDAEVIDWAELDARELLNSCGLDGDTVAVIRGAPARVLAGADHDGLEADALWALVDACDALPLPVHERRGPLWMAVEDTFQYRGDLNGRVGAARRCVIVTGRIGRGSIAVDSEVEIVGGRVPWRGRVRAVHCARRPVERVRAGDPTGVLIEGDRGCRGAARSRAVPP